MAKGWSKELIAEIKMKLPELASAMQAGYDASGIGRRSGKLRAALGTLANYKASARSISITIGLPYARIQDLGGSTALNGVGLYHYARKGKAMRFYDNRTGDLVFARRAKAAKLPGFKYASVHGAAAIQARMNNLFKVGWK